MVFNDDGDDGDTPISDRERRESVQRLTKDLAKAALELSRTEARFLVDSYYAIQRDRIRYANQTAALSEAGEPGMLIQWLESQSRVLENQIKRALTRYAKADPVGKWMQSNLGVGGIITAGFLSHCDITKAPTAGHIFSFAGLNPKQEWKKGQRRPWNAALKTLCWKLGESFVKVSNKDDAFYGQLYKQRKRFETEQNITGEYQDQAKRALEKKNIGKTTDAYGWYAGRVTMEEAAKYVSEKAEGREYKPTLVEPGEGTPMLPPSHIHERAKRWAVKLFISNMHEIMYWLHHKKIAPAPYPIAHLDHVHVIDPPNLDAFPELEAALKKRNP